MSLDVDERDPVLMWIRLGEVCNTMTLAQKSAARKAFLNFEIAEEESYLEIKLRYNVLIRKIIVSGGVLSEEDRLDTLVTSLPKKYDILKESYYAQPVAPAAPPTADPTPRVALREVGERGGNQRGAARVAAWPPPNRTPPPCTPPSFSLERKLRIAPTTAFLSPASLGTNRRTCPQPYDFWSACLPNVSPTKPGSPLA